MTGSGCRGGLVRIRLLIPCRLGDRSRRRLMENNGGQWGYLGCPAHVDIAVYIRVRVSPDTPGIGDGSHIWADNI